LIVRFGRIALAMSTAGLLLAGCSNPDAPDRAATTRPFTPQNAGEPPAPAPTSPGAQAPSSVQRTPAKALTSFGHAYINWTYRTLATDQRTLAASSVGPARLSELQAAASTGRDSTLQRGRVFNRGDVVDVAPDSLRAGWWVIVTREQTGGDAQYEGLAAAYHVTLAQLARLPGGYTVNQWLPQS
jgi:hypothetical protein